MPPNGAFRKVIECKRNEKKGLDTFVKYWKYWKGSIERRVGHLSDDSPYEWWNIYKKFWHIIMEDEFKESLKKFCKEVKGKFRTYSYTESDGDEIKFFSCKVGNLSIDVEDTKQPYRDVAIRAEIEKRPIIVGLRNIKELKTERLTWGTVKIEGASEKRRTIMFIDFEDFPEKIEKISISSEPG